MCSQLYGNSLRKVLCCFHMTKPSPWRNGFPILVLKNWPALSPDLIGRPGLLPDISVGQLDSKISWKVSTAMIWNDWQSNLAFFTLLAILSIIKWESRSLTHFCCLLKIIPASLFYHYFIRRPKEKWRDNKVWGEFILMPMLWPYNRFLWSLVTAAKQHLQYVSGQAITLSPLWWSQ